MQRIKHFAQKAQDILRSTGIHPLSFAAGVVFCIFFPRFFFLAVLAFAIVWMVKNVWNTPGKKKGWSRGKRR